MQSRENKLAELARFENMFHRDNLILGLMVWAKSNGIMWFISLAMALSGAMALLGEVGLLAAIIIGFVLLHWAITTEARRRYGFTPLGSCWWSVYWRVFVYMLPVLVALTLMMPAGYFSQTPEEILANPQPMYYAQIIYLFVSIIPMGLATSKTLLLSWRRLSTFSGGTPPPLPRDPDSGGDRTA